MGCHVVHTFLQCIGESLNDFRMFVDVTLLCRESSVRNIAAVRSKRGDNVSLTLFFKIGCTRFEFYGEVSSSSAEVNALVNRQIFLRVKSILLQNILKYHFRHATFASAQNFPAFQIFPFEILNIFPGNQEVPGALGELGKVYNIIIRPLVICVDRSFRTHKADVGSSGEDGRHSFVGSETSHKRKVDSFVGKISLFDCHIHRSIEDGVCYFI